MINLNINRTEKEKDKVVIEGSFYKPCRTTYETDTNIPEVNDPFIFVLDEDGNFGPIRMSELDKPIEETKTFTKSLKR